MAEQTPRINAVLLEKFQNRTVRITGKVVQLRGETVTLDAQGSITAYLDRESHLTVGHAAEIVGKVNPDLTVKILTSTDMGTNIDYNAVEAVVDACHRYKEIFYDS